MHSIVVSIYKVFLKKLERSNVKLKLFVNKSYTQKMYTL